MDIVDLLEFVDTVDCQLKYAAIEDQLFFFEQLTCNRVSATVSETLIYIEKITVQKFLNARVTDYLGFDDRVTPRTSFGVVSDVLFFTDFPKRIPGINDNLVFTDTFSAFKSRFPTDNLAFVDSITTRINRSPTILDGSLGFDDSASAYIAGKPWFPIIEPFGLAETGGIRLTRQSRVVDLPAPKFGDVDTLTLKRINKTSRGNSLIVAKIPTWWNKTLKRFEWDYLRQNVFNDLQDFLNVNVGKPVLINGIYTSDHTFVVIFLKPEAEFSQIGFDNYTVILDMQVVSLSRITNPNG